ncbi:MAG: RNA polymerase sigma factor [Steroidobacterales bacterium]|jgi:RNA polymerase sigma-70 factor (ECF subfamily)
MADARRAWIERLFAEHSTALRAFFQRRTRSKPNVPDLVQEVYLRLLRVEDADAIRNPTGYLFTVATNLLREQAVLDQRQAMSTDLDEPLAQAELAWSAAFEDDVDAHARVKRLRIVLAQLPPKCQAAVHMKYRHDLSYEEIAGHLGVSVHMVEKYLAQALAHCRRRMARLK